MERRNFIYGISGLIAMSMLACRKYKMESNPEAIPKEFQKFNENVNFNTNYFIDGIPIGLEIITKNGLPVKIISNSSNLASMRYINNYLQTELYNLYDKQRFFKPRINVEEKTLEEAKILIFDKINKWNSDNSSKVTLLTDNPETLLKRYLNNNKLSIFDIKTFNQISINEIKPNDIILDFSRNPLLLNSENYYLFSDKFKEAKNIIPKMHFLECWKEIEYSNSIFTQQPIINKLNINSTNEHEFIFEYFKSINNSSFAAFSNYFEFFKFIIHNYVSKTINTTNNFFDVIKDSFLISQVSEFPNNFNSYIVEAKFSEFEDINPYLIDLKVINTIRDNLNKRELGEVLTKYEFNKNKYRTNSEYKYFENKWGLLIDLDECNGCGNCIISCQIENNIPWVGKEEIEKDRSLNWLRIEKFIHKGKDIFVPIMCQHCDNAPCESVCPVNASTHSPEGLNEAVYNRCIGTRYCMTNCPYKVRKFNFYQYADNFSDNYGNAMNPDVTIRQRGIAEKCSLCVQRLNKAKNDASEKGSKLVFASDYETACQEVCQESAISLINFNNLAFDEDILNDGTAYQLLAEFNTQPSVIYLKKDL
jgi:Fe-S-cluster-containing dehydrogenase component